MSFESEELLPVISAMCFESGKVTVTYSTVIKEDGKSIFVKAHEKELILEGMDECLAKIAKAIAR